MGAGYKRKKRSASAKVSTASRAARKGWATRRAKEEARSRAAKKGWATRKKVEARRLRAVVEGKPTKKPARLAKLETRARAGDREALLKLAEIDAAKATEIAIAIDRSRREKELRERAERARLAQEREEKARAWLARARSKSIRRAAREREYQGQKVENIRIMRRKDGSFTVIGEVRDPKTGKVVLVRGYEVESEGARFFFWGLKRRLDAYTPREAHTRYPRAGADKASFFSAWVNP